MQKDIKMSRQKADTIVRNTQTKDFLEKEADRCAGILSSEIRR
jgi:hypothetical protein